MDFIKNKQLFIILKKSEKLTTAVYMLTNFFDEKESIKWKLRDKSTSFLSFITALVYGHGAGGAQREVKMLAEEIVILLELGKNARLVSPMNFSILKEEYRILMGALYRESEDKGVIADFEFPERFFSEEPTAIKEKNATGNGGELAITDNGKTAKETGKDNSKNALFPFKQNDFYGGSGSAYKKDLRRDTIMKILRTKGEITVKDISRFVSGVSEKTLQRELISLMNEGVIRREGRKRWSRYLLKA